MIVAVIGSYSATQLSYCVNSIFGQTCRENFDVCFSCVCDEYQLADLLQALNMQYHPAVRNVRVDHRWNIPLNEQIAFCLEQAGSEYVLFLVNGAAFYDASALETSIAAAANR